METLANIKETKRIRAHAKACQLCRVPFAEMNPLNNKKGGPTLPRSAKGGTCTICVRAHRQTYSKPIDDIYKAPIKHDVKGEIGGPYQNHMKLRKDWLDFQNRK